jgi:cytochrome c peroxidase
VGGRLGSRNTPSLLNVGAQTTFFWDGRRESLESQVLDPLTNAAEHALASTSDLVQIVHSSARYEGFAGAKTATSSEIASALAAYVRSLGPGQSRFDRYWLAGDKSALTVEERRGFELFRGAAQCSSCHTVKAGEAALTDNGFHSLGKVRTALGDRFEATVARAMAASPADLNDLIVRDKDISELGRFNVTRRLSDIGKYRTPSLRNVAVTEPYMHDGSVPTLEAAVDAEIYYRSIERNRPLILTPLERRDLVAFLRSLTSDPQESSK